MPAGYGAGILENRKKWEHMQKAAYETAEKSHTWEHRAGLCIKKFFPRYAKCGMMIHKSKRPRSIKGEMEVKMARKTKTAETS